ncbi:hypothetical protein D3C71_1870210 [compost metagenome]
MPADFAVTTPAASTLATSLLLLVQMTVRFVAFAGATVAVSVPLPPVVRLSSVGFTLTPVAGTISGAGSVTVTIVSAVKPPSSVVTVILAVPAAFAVTMPLLSTLAISLSLLLQTTF